MTKRILTEKYNGNKVKLKIRWERQIKYAKKQNIRFSLHLAFWVKESEKREERKRKRERDKHSSKWAWNIVCNITDGVLGAVVVYICIHFLLGFVLLRKCHLFMWHVSSYKNTRQYFCVYTGTFLLLNIKYSGNFSMPSSIIIVLKCRDEQMHLTQQ